MAYIPITSSASATASKANNAANQARAWVATLRENQALILAIRAEYPSSWAEVGTAFGMTATNAEAYYNLITGVLTLLDAEHTNINYDLLNYLAGVGG